MPHSFSMKSSSVTVQMKNGAVYLLQLFGCAISVFIISPWKKNIFCTGFIISVIALYLETEEFVLIVRLLKKETKLKQKLPYLLTRIGRIHTHALNLHAHTNYDPLCPARVLTAA